MLIVVAVNAEVFPVAAVRRVVRVVSVPVVDGKEMEVAKVKFPSAFGADPAMKLQGAFPVIIRC